MFSSQTAICMKSKYSIYACVFSFCKDELELRYKWHSSREAEVLGSRFTNVADGHLHTVTIRRLADAVSVQVRSLCNAERRESGCFSEAGANCGNQLVEYTDSASLC